MPEGGDLFRDRREAGQRLAVLLGEYARRHDTCVLALPRGGVPVGYEVARALGAPLDVFLVRKLGVPGHEELAMGAIASGGVRVLNHDIIAMEGVTPRQVEVESERQWQELWQHERLYRDDRPALDVRGRIVIITDDGIATGSTMRAAIAALRALAPARIVVAVPVASERTCQELGHVADVVVCARTPEPFYAVGRWYVDFAQTTDAELHALLAAAWDVGAATAPTSGATTAADASRGMIAGDRNREDAMGRTSRADAGAEDLPVTIATGGVALPGTLRVPPQAHGVVLFAHGSGSSRHSPRNRQVAERLSAAGLATLLMDLLTADEETEDERTRTLRFDVELLAQRLVAATDWLEVQPQTHHLPAGYFGASTGAGAALLAAAARPEVVYAVVARGGRPDLAGQTLHHVRAATLLIVGGNDPVVLNLNRAAQGQLGTAARLEVIPDATHLFEEPGALDRVSDLARDWFLMHLLPHDPLPADFRTGRSTTPPHP